MGMIYLISKNKDRFAWRLITRDGTPVATCARRLATREECVRDIELVRGSWAAVIRDEAVAAEEA